MKNIFEALQRPGLHCVLVKHDAWCPGAHGDGAHCICNPTFELVTEDEMAEALVLSGNRAQRRAAARAARGAGK